MKLLVAGIGNIFLGDDGFGCAVAGLLAGRARPAGIEIADFGIRGMDLAFALTSGFDGAILVDAVARGGTPGTLYVIEPAPPTGAPAFDNHAMDPAAVLRLAVTLGELPAYLRIVGCEPATLGSDDDDDDDLHVGLSPAVTAAIDPAAELVTELWGRFQLSQLSVAEPREITCTR